MTLESTAAWLEGLSLSTAIRDSAWLFPIVETVHVLALALVIGSIATVDLRLLGIARRNVSVATVVGQALPWTWAAFALAIVSGGLLFASSAVRYIGNFPFQIKMLLLLLAGLNMAVFHFGAGRSILAWDQGPTPTGAKLAGALSLAFWIGVVTAGRWIGFINPTPF